MSVQDLRFGVRILLRQPAFTAVAVLTLALGIGANTAIFTLFNAILLQSLPVREPARLVLFTDAPGEGTSVGDPPVGRWNRFSLEIYDFLRRQPLPLESIAAVRSGEAPVSARLAGASADAGPAERSQAHLVSGNYFETMGVAAAMGRVLNARDDRPDAAPVTVVSDGYWSQRLHADPAAVGRVALLNGTAFTIVGVAPREFFGERVRRPPDFWVPLAFQPQIELRPSTLDRADTYWLNLIGRLSPGATRAQAQVAATASLRQFLTGAAGTQPSAARTTQIAGSRIELADGAAGVSGLRYLYSEPLHILLAVVALVLLIACANVGNLQLSRASARQGEMSVRMALGATRGRLLQQLLTESLLLAALGALCGVLLARWVVSALLALIVAKTSPIHASLDAPVLIFTIALAGLAGMLFGLAPAISAGRTDLVTSLKVGGRGAIAGRSGLRLTRSLVVAQIAISLVLLVGANLLTRSLLNLEARPLGFDPGHVLLARINPRLAGYKPASAAALYRRLSDRVSALPGVRAASFANYSPLSGSQSVNSGSVSGYAPKATESVEFETLIVGPAYAETLGMAIVRGRGLGVQDAAGAPKVAMVNEAFGRRFFADQNPVGRRFGWGGAATAGDIEIVGVLGDARFRNDLEDIKPAVFMPMLQQTDQFALDCELEIRTAGKASAAAGELRRAVADVDPNLSVNDPKTLGEQVAANFDSQRLAARLVGSFGALALVLACVGLYGVIAQGVVRRTNEIGVRMALGARQGEVVWMILRDTLVLLAVGVAVGIPAAFGAARLVASQLYGVSAGAPGAFAFAAAVLAAVATVTGMLPAHRASRVDPMVALRAE
jgi:predicted permease